MPIDIISTKSCRLKIKARIAENTPDITVAIVGISVLGLTLARNLKEKGMYKCILKHVSIHEWTWRVRFNIWKEVWT